MNFYTFAAVLALVVLNANCTAQKLNLRSGAHSGNAESGKNKDQKVKTQTRDNEADTQTSEQDGEDDDVTVNNVPTGPTYCPLLFGDFNGDNMTDGRDFLEWQRHYGTTGTPPLYGDGNGDGSVDAADYVMWRDGFGQGTDCGAFDKAITDVNFIEGIDDGYSNQTVFNDLELQNIGSQNPSHYSYIVHYSATPFTEEQIDTYCRYLSFYNDPGLATAEPFNLNISAAQDAYAMLCVLGQIYYGERNFIAGAATSYLWLKDTRLPAAFTASQTMSPANGINLAWTDAQTANDLPNSPMRYQVKIATDAACMNVVYQQNNLSGLSVSASSFTPGNYYACVNAIDLAGNMRQADNSPLMVMAGGAAPGDFWISGPDHNMTVDDFAITWDSALNATSYELKVSLNSDCSSPIIDENLTATFRDIQDIDGGAYYVCVTAKNAFGSTPAMNQFYFVDVNVYVYQVLFVTSGNYLIDSLNNYPPLGGLFTGFNGADYQCSQMASQAGLLSEPWDGVSYPFRALLASQFGDFSTRAGLANIDTLNVNGQLIATNLTNLFAGNFSAPILTQFGAVLTGTNVPVWTGANTSGAWSGSNCSEYQDRFASGSTVGNVKGTGTAWITNTTRACHLGARFYCVGVTP